MDVRLSLFINGGVFDLNKKFVLAALTAMLCMPATTYGEELSEMKDRYEEINSQKLEVQKRLEQNSAIADRMEKELKAIEEDFESTSRELREYEEKLVKLNQDIASSKSELKNAEDKLNQKQELLGSRLSSMYKNRSASYIEVVFDSKDMVDLFDRINMVKNIVSHDKDIIEDVKAQKDDIIEKREQLEKREQESKMAARKLEQRKLEASNLAKSKEAVVSSLKRNEAEYRAQIETLDSESERTMQEIRLETEKKNAKPSEDAGKSQAGGQVSSSSGGSGNQYTGAAPEIDYSNTEKGEAMVVKATAYDPSPEQNGGYGGITAMGTALRPGVIAVDPKVIPLGTKVYIEHMDGTPYGYCIAEDTGGAIKGNRIDILFMNNADAIKFGVRDMKLYILK